MCRGLRHFLDLQDISTSRYSMIKVPIILRQETNHADFARIKGKGPNSVISLFFRSLQLTFSARNEYDCASPRYPRAQQKHLIQRPPHY